jgi:hypothetical protein
LKLQYDALLSKFAFNLNLRHFIKVTATANEEAIGSAVELAAEVVRLRAVIAEGAGEGVKAARARAAELEAHVTRANRCAAAAAKHSADESKVVAGRLEAVEELSQRLDSNLQSTKLVLRLREDALGKLKKGEEADEVSRDQEIEQLRKMAECPPEVGWCRLTVSKSVLKARLASALETKM